ncbi:MAG: aldolase, partial [Treponema sp.]|nr:aldolase [Treponema sp.]
NPKVVEHCLKKNYPITPGIMTPSELEIAVGFGLDVVKFFPAENAGGLKMIKAISAPYTMMKFMPTGGINTTNVRDYLACDKILACGGSWMVKGDLINAGDFAKIQELTKEAAAIVKEIRG